MVLHSCYMPIRLQELLLLMHTLGTAPQLLKSDQNYLFNTCLVFILLFESSFFKSTLADFLSTTNFFPIAVYRSFFHILMFIIVVCFIIQTAISLYLLNNVYLFFHGSHLLDLPFHVMSWILTNSHYFRLCLLSFIVPLYRTCFFMRM